MAYGQGNLEGWYVDEEVNQETGKRDVVFVGRFMDQSKEEVVYLQSPFQMKAGEKCTIAMQQIQGTGGLASFNKKMERDIMIESGKIVELDKNGNIIVFGNAIGDKLEKTLKENELDYIINPELMELI